MSTSLKIALQVDGENPVVGDLYLENGTVRLTATLAEEVAQQLYIRLKTFLGEWFLDPTIGFPWFQSVLGIKVPVGIVAQLIRKLILGTPGVASIKSFSISRNGATRFALVQFSVVLVTGEVVTPPAISVGTLPAGSDYAPSNPGIWEAPAPVVQVDALDRIAFILYAQVLNSTPIPAASAFSWLFAPPPTTQRAIDRLALVLYSAGLDSTQIPPPGIFYWAAPLPVTVQQKIDRLATVVYVDLLDFNPIP